MLTRLALMFAVHVMVLGVFFGRRMDLTRMSWMAWVFAYLIFFYISWALIFNLFPQLIVPELVVP
jgi:hypothetical protein